ncbi:F-box protein At3g22350-like [Rosa chinensis]|uniref:F-box protein At3g22350-like n=1 Tax=Rosa chinensis TaxID=74649 RepID=UPI000D0866AE|nr:F-box protein At3g22350-like [Rosa chinensis]
MTGYLPEEVLEQILHCLPPKAIVKCTLVCKSWKSKALTSFTATSAAQSKPATSVSSGQSTWSKTTVTSSPCIGKALNSNNCYQATQKKDLTRVIKSFEFGYDSRNKNYQVLRILSDGFREFEVYSLARGTWKTLGDIPLDFMPFDYSDSLEHRHVSVNDALHWLVLRREKNKDNAIVCFDLEAETFADHGGA